MHHSRVDFFDWILFLFFILVKLKGILWEQYCRQFLFFFLRGLHHTNCSMFMKKKTNKVDERANTTRFQTIMDNCDLVCLLSTARCCCWSLARCRVEISWQTYDTGKFFLFFFLVWKPWKLIRFVSILSLLARASQKTFFSLLSK